MNVGNIFSKKIFLKTFHKNSWLLTKTSTNEIYVNTIDAGDMQQCKDVR